MRIAARPSALPAAISMLTCKLRLQGGASVSGPAVLAKPGSYQGRAVVTFLDDGRRVQLVDPFAYIDPATLKWDVPAGAIVDGASIPHPLWGIIGGPFEGKYRAASIIHDWYCDVRTRPWKAVHRVFYDAMLTSGVSAGRAKLMYAGVLWGGPRWSETVVANNNLMGSAAATVGRMVRRLAPTFLFGHMIRAPEAQPPKPAGYRFPLAQSDVDGLSKSVAKLDLTAIESLVEDRVQSLNPEMLPG